MDYYDRRLADLTRRRVEATADMEKLKDLRDQAAQAGAEDLTAKADADLVQGAALLVSLDSQLGDVNAHRARRDVEARRQAEKDRAIAWTRLLDEANRGSRQNLPGLETPARPAGRKMLNFPGLGTPARAAGRRTIPQAVKVAVAARDYGRCQCTVGVSCHGYDGMCGSTLEPHFDHVIPWSRGGSDTVGNLQILCGPCNRRKGADEIVLPSQR